MRTSDSQPKSTPIVISNRPRDEMVLGAPPMVMKPLTVHEQRRLQYVHHVKPHAISKQSVKQDVALRRIPLIRVDDDGSDSGLCGISSGSAIAIAPNAACNSLRVYYEGGLYTRPKDRSPTFNEWSEYAMIAAGRAAKQYPTIAMAIVTKWEGLTQIGYMDTNPEQGYVVYLYGRPHITESR